MKYVLTLILVVASLGAHSQTPDRRDGEISGTLTDSNGDPVYAATIYAVPQALAFDDPIPTSAKTNRKGEFEFRDGLPWGEYKLYSRKDEDAYPNPLDTFYAKPDDEAPKVDLTESSRSATVTLTLGEKAGILAGRVIDVENGTPIKARLFFADEDGNYHSVYSSAADGKYRTLLPPGKDISLTVRVMVPFVDRLQVPIPPVQLQSGQEIYLDLTVSKR